MFDASGVPDFVLRKLSSPSMYALADRNDASGWNLRWETL
jgi:hypothetical protein